MKSTNIYIYLYIEQHYLTSSWTHACTDWSVINAMLNGRAAIFIKLASGVKNKINIQERQIAPISKLSRIYHMVKTDQSQYRSKRERQHSSYCWHDSYHSLDREDLHIPHRLQQTEISHI